MEQDINWVRLVAGVVFWGLFAYAWIWAERVKQKSMRNGTWDLDDEQVW